MRHRNILWVGFAAGVAVVVVALTLTYMAAAQGAARIQYGETVEGEIAAANEVDRWEFDGTQGDVIAIQIRRAAGNLVPAITLSDPDGVLIVSLEWPVEGPPDTMLTATLRTSGPHTLAISGAAHNATTTGFYTLGLELQEAGIQQEGILTYGRVVSGEINDTTFREFWTFRGTRGDVVDLMMTATSGDLDTYVSLVSPQGDVLANADTGGTGTDAALFAVTLPTTGNYSISARRVGGNFGENGTTQGAYNLALTLRRPGSEDVEPTPVTLTPGMGTRGRLNADVPTALFSVNAGGVLALALDMTDPTQVGTLTVMTPEGALLNTFSGITPVRAGVTLPEPGTYWIEVSAIGIRESAPIDFGINVEQLATAQRAARPLIYDRPQQIPTSPTQPGPEAWYFHGRAGDLVDIVITPFNPELEESTIQIAAPDGTVLVTRSVRTQITQSLLLADGGAYEILLSEGALRDGYQIVVNRKGLSGLDFRQHAEPDMQGALPPAGIGEKVLEAGGADGWTIDIHEEQTWEFVLDQSGTDVPAALVVEAPDGKWLGTATTDRLTNTATLRVRFPHAGRYRALVFDPTHTASHTYTLQGAPGEGGELASDSDTKGVLTATDPADRWAVQAAPDTLLNINLKLLAGTGTPTIHVIEPDGLLVASNASGEQRDSLALVGIPVTYGGQFDVLVSQPPNGNRVVYQIETNVVAPFGRPADVTPIVDLPVEEVFAVDNQPDTISTRVQLAEQITPRIQPDAEFLAAATTIDVDTLERGEIQSDQPYQAWQFSANTGQMIGFSVVALETTSGPDLMLLNTEGAVLAETLQDDSTSTYMMHRFAESGTYTLVVKLDQGGRYTLFAEALTGIDETVPQVIPGQTMTYGDTVEGEIIRFDDVQRYVFWGKAGDVVHARALRTQGNTNLNLSLVDAGGLTLQQAAMETVPPLAEITGYELPNDALYQLMVTHNGDDAGIAGRFALSLTLAEASASQRDGGVLNDGTARIANLDTQDHHWLFAGLAGERVTIRVEPLTDGAPTPLMLQMTDSDGNVFLQKEASIGQGALVFERVLLPRTGVYQAIVSGGRTPGIYRIGLARDTRYTQDDERAIRYGETTGKVLTPENFLDVWTFAGTEGDVITAAVRAVRGDMPVLSLQLRTPDGLVLGTALENGTGSRIEHITLPSDGHYSLIVGNVDGTFVGEAAYAITLLLEDSAARSMGTVMDYGQTVEGYFFLDDSTDTWLFEGQQGDVISATVTSASPGLNPVIELVSTDWRAASAAGQISILASAQGAEDSPAVLEFVLPATGAYALRLRDQALVGGPYTLELDTLTPTAASPEAIRYGQSKTGQLGDIHVADSWQFEGAVGEAVSIVVEPDSRSQLAPSVTLLNMDGEVLAAASALPGGSARIEAYPLTRSDVYTVVVSRHLGAAGYTDGRYTVSLQSSVFDTRDYPTTSYGQIQRGALGADNAQDRWMLIESEPGDVVRVYAEATSGDLDPTLRVFDAEGRIIAGADDVNGALNAELYVPVGGPVFIEVARYGGEEGMTEGNYALAVDMVYRNEPAPPEYAYTLAYGDRVAASVDGESPGDIWAFAGVQGDVLRAKIQFPRDDSPLALYLLDPSGEILATGERDRGDSVIARFMLPYNGTYTLEVLRPGDARAVHSPYALELALLSVAESRVVDHGGLITAGLPVTALFAEVPASHTWIFEGLAQIPVSLTVSRLDGELPSQMALYGPDGSVVFVMQAPPGTKNVFATGTIRLPYDGLYTLVITGGETSAGSSYRVALREMQVKEETSSVGQISPLEDGFGAITDVQPFERWAFVLDAGDVITLRASALAGDLEPTLLLWGPDRRPLAEGVRETIHNKQAVIRSVAAPVSGIYEITVGRVGGRAGTTNGEYRVMVRRGAAAISSQAASADDVALNTQIKDYTAGKSTAYYAFRGTGGDVIGVSVRLTETGELPDLALETESGMAIQVPVITTENEAYLPAFALPAEGRYVVKLDSRSTVGYELSTFRRESVASDNAVRRSLGRDRVFVEGVLDPARPTYWQFQGNAGEVLAFTIDTSGGGLRADATLYGPYGYIANAVEYPGPGINLGPVRLPATGDYLLIVGPWLGELGGSTGQYSVQVTTAEAGVSGSDGGHLAVWGQHVTGGLIAEDTQDVWTFDGLAGDTVTIRGEQTFGEGSFSLTLAGPDGTPLIGSEPATSYLGSEITGFTLPAEGVYTITVNGSLAGDSPVEYRLVVSQETDVSTDAAALNLVPVGTLDGHANGRVSVTEPVQSWTLTPTYTGTYVIALTPLAANVALDVFVVSADEAIVSGGQVEAGRHTQAIASLVKGRTYTVLVSGGPALSQGRYTLEVMPAITVSHGETIGVSESNVGQIDGGMLHNEWRLQGQANATWVVEVMPTAGNLIPEVTLVGPTGGILQETVGDSSDPLAVTFQVPADGAYAIVISGAGQTAGDYTITVLEG